MIPACTRYLCTGKLAVPGSICTRDSALGISCVQVRTALSQAYIHGHQGEVCEYVYIYFGALSSLRTPTEVLAKGTFAVTFLTSTFVSLKVPIWFGHSVLQHSQAQSGCAEVVHDVEP